MVRKLSESPVVLQEGLLNAYSGRVEAQILDPLPEIGFRARSSPRPTRMLGIGESTALPRKPCIHSGADYRRVSAQPSSTAFPSSSNPYKFSTPRRRCPFRAICLIPFFSSGFPQSPNKTVATDQGPHNTDGPLRSRTAGPRCWSLRVE